MVITAELFGLDAFKTFLENLPRKKKGDVKTRIALDVIILILSYY